MNEAQLKHYNSFPEVAMVIENKIFLKSNSRICKADALKIIHPDHRFIKVDRDNSINSDYFEIENNMYILSKKTNDSIAKLLNYSFNPIHWEYKGLAPTEKSLVTEKEFNNLKRLYANK